MRYRTVWVHEGGVPVSGTGLAAESAAVMSDPAATLPLVQCRDRLEGDRPEVVRAVSGRWLVGLDSDESTGGPVRAGTVVRTWLCEPRAVGGRTARVLGVVVSGGLV